MREVNWPENGKWIYFSRSQEASPDLPVLHTYAHVECILVLPVVGLGAAHLVRALDSTKNPSSKSVLMAGKRVQ